MLDSAVRTHEATSHENGGGPDEPSPQTAEDIRRAAAALVQLEAWCRQRGMDEIARLLEPALDWSDRALTGS